MNNLGHILMADDSDEDLELAQRALVESKLANRIVVVRDGAEALDYLYCRGSFSLRDRADPIVVLLDISMPKVNGIEVLGQMKADPHLRTIPVVMLTSSRQGPDVDQCYRLNANAYVVKPVDFEQFADAIRTIGKFWGILNEGPPAIAKAVALGE
jgi:CheY-like chemotaxis protein